MQKEVLMLAILEQAVTLGFTNYYHGRACIKTGGSNGYSKKDDVLPVKGGSGFTGENGAVSTTKANSCLILGIGASSHRKTKRSTTKRSRFFMQIYSKTISTSSIIIVNCC